MGLSQRMGMYDRVVRSRAAFAGCVAFWLCLGWLGVVLWSVPWGLGAVGWVAQSVWGGLCAAVWSLVGVQVVVDRWDAAGLPAGFVRAVGWLAAVVVAWSVWGIQPIVGGWGVHVPHVLHTLHTGAVSVWVGCVSLGVCVPSRTAGMQPHVPAA